MNTPNLTEFDAVLLDMNGTFMFGHDRFGENEDYKRTYRSLGGLILDRATLHRVVTSCIEEMDEKYRDVAWRCQFPSVRDTLLQQACKTELPRSEIDLIANVIASHEMGDVSPSYAQVLRKLSSTHKLGVVSNIFSDKCLWLDLFEKRGLLDLFDVLVFSSDGAHVKPSPALFEQAITALRVSPSRTLFVGDDPQCDIVGASAVGMRTALVGRAQADGIVADWYMPNLIHLDQKSEAQKI